ncbi:MAG TPA: serine/threonine-protein kinase [Phycisphaerae bacterium]|nr:serine/threonine-protein kinase [Phycisphaerae bacterium]
MRNDHQPASDKAVDSDSQLVEFAWQQIASIPREDAGSSDAATAAFNRHSLSPDSFMGYRLVREIHRGGQGVVFEAIQESTDRVVAIKVLRQGPFADRTELTRFEREIHVLSRLNHPNIVTIHDCSLSAGHSFLVMDYVRGRGLDQYLVDADHSREESLQLFMKICDAVHAAHLRGIIHRDLKPGNIRIDEAGEPHVLDFGLAKLTGANADDSSPQTMTLTGQFVGSMPWASPEQVTGQTNEIDLRTDVYSLGVILYQLLTGAFPYPVTGKARDVQDRIVNAPPMRPSSVRSVTGRIDGDLDTIVLKCLAKQPDRRYQSAGELAQDLRHFLAGEPIEAKRDSFVYVLRKQISRHWGATVVASNDGLTAS